MTRIRDGERKNRRIAGSTPLLAAALSLVPPAASALAGIEPGKGESGPVLIQVLRPHLVLYVEPDETSRKVAVVTRGQVLESVEQRGAWFRLRLGSRLGPEAMEQTGWARRQPAEYGEASIELISGTGQPRYAAEQTGVAREEEPLPAKRPGDHPSRAQVLPPIDPTKVEPPGPNLPRESLPVPDRWRIMQALDFKFPWYDPYNQNVLKGDLPLTTLGPDIFGSLIAVSDSLAEFREVPNPVAQSISRNVDANDIFGDGEQQLYATTLLLGASVTRGDTTYRPPDFEFRLLGAFNFNYARANEAGVLRANPLDCGGVSRPRLAANGTALLPASPGESDVDFDGATDGGEDIQLFDDDGNLLPPAMSAIAEPGAAAFLDDSTVALPLVTLQRAGDCSRRDGFIGIQEFFFDYHLRNVSDRYDFDSIRIGIQPFTSDFRGFLFLDQPLGIRLFGNRDNNRWQYNVAAFARLEKDTNSGLNDISVRPRRDYVLTANLYRQDFPFLGFTSQLSWTSNLNREDEQHYDKNGFLVRPAVAGSAIPHQYSVHYLGYSGDGHLGRLWPVARLNWSTSTYFAFGEDNHNPIAGRAQDIRAFFHASEVSRDFDWVRLRLNLLYASGDDDPRDDTAEGFDAVFETPQFAGADTAYFIRQGIPLIGGGGVAMSGRNGILPSLRPSREQGQSNFVNPGLRLFGAGADLDVTPRLRLTANLSRLHFVDTAVLGELRQQRNPDSEIGTDFSMGIQIRPLFNQNFVINASGSLLKTGAGLDDFYGTDTGVLYSTFVNVILAY